MKTVEQICKENGVIPDLDVESQYDWIEVACKAYLSEWLQSREVVAYGSNEGGVISTKVTSEDSLIAAGFNIKLIALPEDTL